MTRTKDEITAEIATLAKRQRFWSGVAAPFWLAFIVWMVLRWTSAPIADLLWLNILVSAILLASFYPLTRSLLVSRVMLRLNRERDAAPKTPAP